MFNALADFFIDYTVKVIIGAFFVGLFIGAIVVGAVLLIGSM